MHGLDFLVAVELALLADTVQVLQHGSAHHRVLRGLGDGGEVRGVEGLLQQGAGVGREGSRVDTEDGDQRRLRRVAVDVGLGQDAGVGEVDVLDALGRDVLALSELEDVLAAIDDLEAAELVDLRNVASRKPPVRVDRLGCLLGVLIVLSEQRVAPDH